MMRTSICLTPMLMLCLVFGQATAQDDEMSMALSIHYDELVETAKEVKAYTNPENQAYMVSSGRYEYFLRAISPKAREKWDSQWLTNPNHKKKFQDKYNEIAAEAANKMAIYVPANDNFAFSNSAEETLMKSKLKNPSVKIHKIGLRHSTWQISKDSYDKIEARYKQGFIWARDSSDDHSFCHLYQVNIKQDYQGGGKYGESYAVLINDSLRGCPR